MPDSLKPFLSTDLKADPAITAIREHLHAAGKPQGALDSAFEYLDVLAKKGLIEAPFDAAKERTALGANGEARQREVETNLRAMKDRGELDDAEFGEAMSLVPTAAGTRLLEKLRRGGAGGDAADLKPPGGDTPADTRTEAQRQADEMHKDPRYKSDSAFRHAADKAYMAAYA